VSPEAFSENVIIRVLEPGRWWLYEEDGDAEESVTRTQLISPTNPAGVDPGERWKLIAEGELRKSATELWDRVPLFTFYTDQKVKSDSDYEVKPPFLDLA
jgi:hypothetical protein